MDLLSTFSELQKTSIPNLLVIAGILFLLLSFAGELGAIIKVNLLLRLIGYFQYWKKFQIFI